MTPIQNRSTDSFYSKARSGAVDAINDRLPLKRWLRNLSFAAQVILYAYSVPGMFGTLLMGHLDYQPDELGRMLRNLALLTLLAMVLNMLVRSRRSFLAYLGYSALANLLLILGALTCMAL